MQSKSLQGIYDYGHLELLGIDLERSLELLLPRAQFITVKDSARVGGPPRFLLPGDGTIDYQRYCAKLKALRWSGWMLVEVSSQLHSAAGYDPILTAVKCYRYLAPLLRTAGLRP